MLPSCLLVTDITYELFMGHICGMVQKKNLKYFSLLIIYNADALLRGQTFSNTLADTVA